MSRQERIFLITAPDTGKRETVVFGKAPFVQRQEIRSDRPTKNTVWLQLVTVKLPATMQKHTQQ